MSLQDRFAQNVNVLLTNSS